MPVEANLNKLMYRIELYLIKVIPIIASGIYLLNTILSYFYIDLPVLSYIIMFLFIAFLFTSSYAFRFCAWHRVSIWYITVNLILNIIDFYVGIALSDRDLFTLYMAITGLFIFVLLYLRFKE